MKNLLFFLLFLLHSLNVFSQKLTDTIHWRSDYNLRWEDFKGKPTYLSPTFSATSVMEFSPKFISINDTTIIVKVAAVFLKKKSWVRIPILDSATLLNHEQRHFDIAYIFSRKLEALLNNAVSQNNIKTTNGARSEYNNLLYKIHYEALDYHARYDEETQHSKNRERQNFWNEKIQKMINEPDSFFISKWQ